MTSRDDLNGIRNVSGDLWNVAVDEHQAGFLSRRDLFKYASLLGLTGLAASQGLGMPSSARAATAKPGGKIRVALDQPTGAIDPVSVTDPASIGVISQVGEYLLFDDSEHGLQPSLAVSWSGNDDATEWTFKLRSGVKFHDGQVLSAKDVVATFERLVNPSSGSSALSAYKGLILPGSIKASGTESGGHECACPGRT